MESKALRALGAWMAQKGFVWGPEPELYGGVAGFYTYGPLGALLKRRVEDVIRRRFLREGFFEVECPTILPRKVWEASGHLAGFADVMARCGKCSAVFRVDNLLAEAFPDADIVPNEYEEYLSKTKCPACGAPLEARTSKHSLMLKVTVGLDTEAYARPETATATYLPFLRYAEFFRGKLPFGVFQIGKAYRNEISPRQHLLRMREFTQAEAQFFVHPDRKDAVEVEAKALLPLWTWDAQCQHKPVKDMAVGEALAAKLLSSPAYAWALALAHALFLEMGIPKDRLRLRQHGPDEKAFYARDAWDLEIKLKTFGWTEVCGIHDRTNYDLSQHAKMAGKPLEMDEEGTKVQPHVLEIAFGVDRPVFALLDLFYEKLSEEEGKTTFRVPPALAPIPVAVFPLFKKEGMPELANKIHADLARYMVARYDEAGSIGKRYLRAAEEGTPYCVTVDYDSLKDKTVTLRDRDSEKQKRVKIGKLPDTVRGLLDGSITFKELK